MKFNFISGHHIELHWNNVRSFGFSWKFAGILHYFEFAARPVFGTIIFREWCEHLCYIPMVFCILDDGKSRNITLIALHYYLPKLPVKFAVIHIIRYRVGSWELWLKAKQTVDWLEVFFQLSRFVYPRLTLLRNALIQSPTRQIGGVCRRPTARKTLWLYKYVLSRPKLGFFFPEQREKLSF